MEQPPRRPGDLILDRLMPYAGAEQRERAHENLRTFAKALLRIAMREVREERDSQEPGTQGRIQPPPNP
jgi:hypothetical protein